MSSGIRSKVILSRLWTRVKNAIAPDDPVVNYSTKWYYLQPRTRKYLLRIYYGVCFSLYPCWVLYNLDHYSAEQMEKVRQDYRSYAHQYIQLVQSANDDQKELVDQPARNKR